MHTIRFHSSAQNERGAVSRSWFAHRQVPPTEFARGVVPLEFGNSDQADRRRPQNDPFVVTAVGRDRLKSLVEVLLESVDDPAGGAQLAARVYLSRYHFQRIVASALGESPGGFRRRLLLERAAWELQHGASVTETAFAAGYASAEPFSRAFARAFAAPPSRYAGDFRLSAPNGIHFHPPGGLLVPAGDERRETMDFVDRMIEHDLWLTRQLLDAAATLPDEKLDETFDVTPGVPHDFPPERPSVRDMLDRLISSKEVWTAAIAGREAPQSLLPLACRAPRALRTLGNGVRCRRPRHS
jgi:AraC family transcriptional regulator